MADTAPYDADELRARGIDHEFVRSDAELVAIVEMLEALGVELAEMQDTDLSLLSGPRIIRPDALPHPSGLADLDDEFTRRLVLALGFHFGSDRLGLTRAEADALMFFRALRDLFPDDDLLAIVRVVGTATAAIARSISSALRLNFETPILESTGSLIDVLDAYRTLNDDLFPPFLEALSTTVRRQVARLAGERSYWAVDQSHSQTREQVTVGFVDLVGFTAFTEQAAPSEFIDTVRRFEIEVNELVVDHGGVLVKLIGDEAMFVTVEPSTAVDIAVALGGLRVGAEGTADVRVGMATGWAVSAGGDYYGSVVNTAARASTMAEPGSVVVTAATARACQDCFTSIGTHQLRGLSEPIELFSMSLDAAPERTS